MVTSRVTIQNRDGIHCRPSAVIIKAVQDYSGAVKVMRGEESCDPRSILGLMSMGLQQGAEIVIQVDGPDEQKQLDTLCELFTRNFDFPPREA